VTARSAATSRDAEFVEALPADLLAEVVDIVYGFIEVLPDAEAPAPAV
jgi:hypothetical protein